MSSRLKWRLSSRPGSWSLGKAALFAAVALAAAALVNQMVGCMSAAAQIAVPVAAVNQAADRLIERMSREAGVVFAGRVMAVHRPAGFAAAAEGVVEIDFIVDEAVRGAAVGSTYKLREWAGLWAGSAQRYRVGQRLLMFLYMPVENGFASTVHGPEGAIPLRGAGRAPGPDDLDDVGPEVAVDLRWVQAQEETARDRSWVGVGTPMHGGAGPVLGQSRGIRSEGVTDNELENLHPVRGLPGPWMVGPPTLKRLPFALQTPEPQIQPLSQVLELCRQSIRQGIRVRDAAR